jgi:hypothetical protein
MLRKHFAILHLLYITTAVFPQGGHYWTEQYGTRSILMSSAVIGGVEDLGAVYYNPGRLPLVENRAFLLSANLYQLQKLRVLNAVDDGKDLTNQNFGGVPGLAAGTFKLPFAPKHIFAYAVLARQRSDYSFFIRSEKEGALLEEISGTQYFTGRLQMGSRYNEEWMCLTWAYPIKDNFSIGVTSVYAATNSSKNIEMQLQLLYDDKAKVAQLIRNRVVDMSHDGLLWKIGLAWELPAADIGVTLATPKIHVRGKGNFIYEDFLSGLPDSVEMAHFESNLQSDLYATHKSPFSIGAGASFSVLKKHIFHVSGEWFGIIPGYTILAADPFIGQSTGEEINYSLLDQAERVFNFGAGIELKMREALSFYASYSSDYSYVPTDISRFSEFGTESYNSTFRADINHAGAGFVLKLTRADITLGTTYAWARESVPRPIDFPDEGEGNSVFNSENTADLLWSRWRFIFSFSVPFLKDVQKNIEGKIDNRKTEDDYP